MKRQQQHQFLSASWFKRTQRMRDATLPLHEKQCDDPGHRLVANLTVHKTPFNEEPFLAHFDTTDTGLPNFSPGHHEDACTQITVDYETAFDLLIKGRKSVLISGLLRRKFKIDGGKSHLLDFAKSGTTDAQDQLLQEITQMTTLEASTAVRAPAVELAF